MNVRKLLAAQRVASRAGGMTAVLFFFGAIAGCSSTVSDEDIERGIAHPAQDAATIAEARAINLRDEINRLKREEDELKRKRSDCLKQASYYLAKSAAVWSDASVSERERPVRAGQFSTLADEKQAQADRYEQMVEACVCRIASLETERENQLKRVEDYKSQAIPVPSAE